MKKKMNAKLKHFLKQVYQKIHESSFGRPVTPIKYDTLKELPNEELYELSEGIIGQRVLKDQTTFVNWLEPFASYGAHTYKDFEAYYTVVDGSVFDQYTNTEYKAKEIIHIKQGSEIHIRAGELGAIAVVAFKLTEND